MDTTRGCCLRVVLRGAGDGDTWDRMLPTEKEDVQLFKEEVVT